MKHEKLDIILLWMVTKILLVYSDCLKLIAGGHPESTYSLRVSGWVQPKAYSHIQGGWIGKGQSVRTGMYDAIT